MNLFSDDQWRWFRTSLSSANGLLEESLSRESSSISASPHYVDPEDHAEAFYYRVEEPGSVLRAGLFFQLVGGFEYTLYVLLIDVSDRTEAKRPALLHRDVIATRLRALGVATGKDYISRAEEIIALTRLRNLLMHAGGDWAGMPEDKDPAIQKWIEGHPELTSESGGAIVLQSGFFLHCHSLYESWIRELLEDVRRL